MKERRLLTTKNLAVMGMLGALAGVLMLFEMPLPIAPTFYKMDISEVPVLIGTFALGPVAGCLIELVKILVKLVLKSSSTAGIGDFANVIIGYSLIIPAGIIYKRNRTKRGSVIGMAVGTASMTLVGTIFNAVVMLPFYSTMMPMETILAAGAAIHPSIDSVWKLAWFCVAPFNLIKGLLVSVLTALIYKRVSSLIHSLR